MGIPVAYLRKSRVTVTSPGEMSYEAQLAAVRDLAARHGDADPLILSDWSRSGRRTAGRPEYRRLLDMIRTGEASAVYSYSLSRLARSVEELSRLVAECAERGIPVRLDRDHVDTSTASGKLLTNVLASVAQFEADVAQERAKDTIAQRRSRGDHVGSAPYGFILQGGILEPDPDRPIEPVVEAYREARTFAGAARLLNARGVMAARARKAPVDGDPKWSGTGVRRVVNRVLPETRATGGKPGRHVRNDFMLSRLLRCPCGNVMTGRDSSHRRPRARTGKVDSYRFVSYQCFRGRYEPDHPKPYMISEKRLLPWIQAEAARFRIADPVEREVLEDSGSRDELDARRRRVIDLAKDGIIERAELDAELSAIADELERLDSVTTVVDVPAIDWQSWEPADVNRVLRAYWNHVELGPDLQPVRAEWRIPQTWLS